MADRQQYVSSEKLPAIDNAVIAGVLHDCTTDPEYLDRVLRTTNESHRALIQHMVAEAYKQSNGDLGKQLSYIKGAEFVLAVFTRQSDVNELRDLWEQELTIPTVYDDEVKQP